MQAVKQGQTVFAAGDPDRNMITVVHHAIAVHGLTEQAKESLEFHRLCWTILCVKIRFNYPINGQGSGFITEQLDSWINLSECNATLIWDTLIF